MLLGFARLPSCHACKTNVEHAIAIILDVFHVNIEGCSDPVSVQVFCTINLLVAPVARIVFGVMLVVISALYLQGCLFGIR